MDKLRVAFNRFRNNPLDAVRVAARRRRAAEVRTLLTAPEQLDITTFNREAWVISEPRGNAEQAPLFERLFGSDAIADADLASLKAELVEARLYGNWIWRPAASVYGSALKQSAEQKTAIIRDAARILGDTDLTPLQKAHRIDALPGFGECVATGLAMVFHPTECALTNSVSRTALAKLGLRAGTLEDFQAKARQLLLQVGAEDFIELDWFFYQIHMGKVPDLPETAGGKPPSPIASGRRNYWVLSPGENGRLWGEFQEQGIAAIGMDYLGDLKQYTDQEAITQVIVAHRDSDVRPVNDSLAAYQFANEIAVGDYIIAKIGQRKLLGIGIVKSDYLYDPSRSEYQHTRKVSWLRSANVEIPETCRLPTKALTNVTEYTAFVEFATEQLLGDETIPRRETPTLPPYTVEQALEGAFVPRRQFEEMISSLRRKKNIILQGPPGVGKTYLAKRLAYALMGFKDPARVEMVQFHQAYAYEDFVQGWRPNPAGGFERKNGGFYRFCLRAKATPDLPFVFVIDEINRGNLSRIFGELMMLIEPDKRGPEFAMPLTYSQGGEEAFFVPENVHMIGLMNTADRSLAMVDYALRRRFVFYELSPQFETAAFRDHLKAHNAAEELITRIIERMGRLNEAIVQDTKNLGCGYAVGHSFFCSNNGSQAPDMDWYRSVIEGEIAPLIREYWFDRPETAKKHIDSLLA